MTQSANDILTNLRRARRAVRGGPAGASVVPSGSSPAVIVPLPEIIPLRGSRSDDAAGDPVLRRPPSVRAIIVAVAAAYGVSPLEIVAHRRGRGIILPRQLVMYLARHFTTASFPEIGRALRRDHSTVLHGVRAVEVLLAGLPPIPVDRSTRLAELVDAHRAALEQKRNEGDLGPSGPGGRR
jgi:hypothetical protein